MFNMVMSLYGCSSGLPENTRCVRVSNWGATRVMLHAAAIARLCGCHCRCHVLHPLILFPPRSSPTTGCLQPSTQAASPTLHPPAQLAGPVCGHGGGGHRGAVPRRGRVPLCGDEVRVPGGGRQCLCTRSWPSAAAGDSCKFGLVPLAASCASLTPAAATPLARLQPLGGQQLPHAQPGDVRGGERGGGAHRGEPESWRAVGRLQLGRSALPNNVAPCPCLWRNRAVPTALLLSTCSLLCCVAPALLQKAEDFLRRAQQRNRFAGGAFDFMSGQG